MPSKREKAFLKRITLIMGNRNQLNWDLPALDSFNLNRAIFGIPKQQFVETRDEFVEILDLGKLVDQPVRNLSLGERMKMEIVGALLHRPDVLFLDEPTIGLDVTMQRRLREFVSEYNTRYGATVLLTSHHMADVVALCNRVVVIHHGQILHDGDLSGLVARFAACKTIVVTLETSPPPDLSSYGEVVDVSGDTVSLRLAKADVSRINPIQGRQLLLPDRDDRRARHLPGRLANGGGSAGRRRWWVHGGRLCGVLHRYGPWFAT